MKCFSKTEKKGSALLVVLGFLSFMIISAVSFAIYMRVERQASSSYRHAITARHLLESALYRAMDEVDEDLRTTATDKKFPNHWRSRIFTSQSNTSDIEEARVLSLEALSFLPASVVNDARTFALGTQWRRLSMPIESQIDIGTKTAKSSGGKSYVGRYAYICVNLSDMINVNNCLLTPERNGSNLVSVASLFSTPTDPTIARQMGLQCSNDVYYASLQDFYACMAVAGKSYFGGATDSPYIQFLRDGKNLSFNDSYNHLLVADGFAKRPPVQSGACNVMLNPPFSPSQLASSSDGVGPAMDATFSAKIRELFPDALQIAQDGWPFQAMLADYLSKDSVGVMRLDAPSSKLAPMICQVRLADAIRPNITSVTGGPPPDPVTTYSLNLVSDLGGLGLQVRVCFPFKNVESRIKEYTLQVDGFIRVDKQSQATALTSAITQDAANDKAFTGSATFTPLAIDGVGDAQTVQGKCYQWIPVPFSFIGPNPTGADPIKMATVTSSGTKTAEPGFNVNNPVNVALVITSMKVQIGTVIYDAVPGPPPGLPLADAPKLYFQTGQSGITPATPCIIPYQWDSLEVPDPRFNHYVANWINNSADPDRFSSDPTKQVHAVTKNFLGLDGRDADIFMSSSGAERLQSVGELGFIIRPYLYDPMKGLGTVDLKTRIAPAASVDDSEAFFRTIRLYDQGDKVRDKIYENFYLATDADGSLPQKANVRINPLSSVAPIIKCALDRIPYNYGIASGGSLLPKQNYTEGVLKDNWEAFADAWAKIFTNQVKVSGLNGSFLKTLAEFYGDKDLMGWYSAEKEMRQTIFNSFLFTSPLFEVDRKMLQAFSLDSMSDRQQLFLYVFQAESVAPISFAEMRSLAGGRAVAVVWRDPYPLGSTPSTPDGLADTWYGNTGGSKGYHEQKILFFKQLDN